MDETKYWMWLSMIFGTGSRRLWEAMCLFETAEEAYLALSEKSAELGLSENELDNINTISLSDAEAFIGKCADKGVSVVGFSDEDYPVQLRHLFNPPAILYYKGSISCLNGTRTVTSVGTRSASEYGLRAADIICGELAAKNVVIVSGFAVGIDVASQLAAVRKNRPSVGVLGCGVDVNYPKPNEKFRDMILQSGGAFVSEYPPETQPYPQNFPSRNRILAALGRVAVVFEAALKSGSLITARLASEQGRDLFVLPPADIFGSSFSGNLQLLSEGAQPLYSSEDILECFRFGTALDAEIRQSIRCSYTGREAGIVWQGLSRGTPEIEKVLSIPTQRRRKPKKVSAPAETEAVQQEAPESTGIQISDASDEELTDVQRSITNELKGGMLHADEICRRLDIDPSELMTELTELELIGAIRSHPGKMFELC